MNRLLRHLTHWSRDRSGAAAIEYAFVLPVFAMLLIGVINMSQLMGALSGMHFAVEEAARCSAVNATLCPNPSSTIAYAASRYDGPDVGPQFQATQQGCGHSVTATAQFELDVAVAVFDVPISAAACYPAVA